MGAESCLYRKRAENGILARGQHEGANPAGAHTRVCLTSTDIGGLNLPTAAVLTTIYSEVVKTAAIGKNHHCETPSIAARFCETLVESGP